MWGWRSTPDWDDDAIALWEEVLAAQPADDVLTRARLTAAIAVELLTEPGAGDRATRLADEAVVVVRRSDAPGRRAHRRDAGSRPMALLRPDLLHHRRPCTTRSSSSPTRSGTPRR